MASKKTLLLTGGAWYIGSHASVAFELAGYRTVIVDNFCNSDRSVFAGMKKILSRLPASYDADIRNEEALVKIMKAEKIDAVVHFAGLKSPFESQFDTGTYHDNNVVGTVRLLSAMQKCGVKDLVFSSSANVYSAKNASPLRESAELWPNNPYGTTKWMIEKLLEDFSRFQNFRVIALRYFNPVWAHSSGHIWERPNGTPNNLLPFVMDVALRKRPNIRVFWTDYPTPDGTGIRDYIHVEDLSEAHVSAYEHLLANENPLFLPINVGTGIGTSVLEMIAMVEEVSAKTIPLIREGRRPWDLAEAYADVSKASEVLGWKAKRTVLEGVRDSWNFVTKNASQYHNRM